MYSPLNWPTFLRLAQPVNGFMQTLGPFQGFFMGKGRQEGVPGAGQGANWGLDESNVGQNSEGQAWAPKNEP